MPPPTPPLFLSLPSPPPPLLPLRHPKAAQTLTLAPPVTSRKAALPACPVASPSPSDYFDPRGPRPPQRGDGYGRPPPPNGAQEGRVFTSYSIYKGKAALSFDPRPPLFVPLDVAARTCSPGRARWRRRDSCCCSSRPLSPHGSMIGLASSEEGKVRKVLKVELTPDGNGRFFNLSVQNHLLNIDESIYIPITKGEFAVIVSTFNYIIPHLMGWSTFISSIKPEDSRPYNRPQSTPEFEWRR